MKDSLASRFATWVSEKSGSTPAFMIALAVIAIWGITGPIFHYSDTWQLVINTSTTIVTFLMVFLIQRAQNKGELAVQLKLNELVAAIDAASNRLISIEDLSETELQVLHHHYRQLAEMAKKEAPLASTHSVEEAGVRHHRKSKRRRERSERGSAT
ncbi:MAG TPA: low affinity iron permease family protein [Thermoanaerobaculia bacterium]|nr:low affinity iron permease family protein [Thermoanaerobaculia bacterium]